VPALASLAHNSAPDACRSAANPAALSRCRSKLSNTLTSLMSKPSFAMLAIIIGAVRDSFVEHDVALGSGDEEGRTVLRADVIEVTGYAERFGRLLPAAITVAFYILPRIPANTVTSPNTKTSTRRLMRCSNVRALVCEFALSFASPMHFVMQSVLRRQQYGCRPSANGSRLRGSAPVPIGASQPTEH
jgi:hypothetical protein